MKTAVVCAMALVGCGGGLPAEVDMAVGDGPMLPQHCTNEALDPEETGVDCGGPCAGCAVGKTCKRGSDCQSKVCTNSLCEVPSCSDKVKNGDESDADCGGQLCPSCGTGKMCNLASDCLSAICSNNVCTAPACSNGKKDESETDVDCGGGTCPLCALGQMCALDVDCEAGLCDGGVCTAPPSCMDGMQNSLETDVDCGGGMCAKCEWGKKCGRPEDCTSGRCLANARCGGMNLTLAFAMPTRWDWGGGMPFALRFADLSGDGRADIGVVAFVNPASLVVRVNDGKLGFAMAQKAILGGSPAAFLGVGDFDADKKPDAVAYDQTGKFLPFKGNGDGTFLAQANVPYANGWRAQVADFDGDGRSDIVATSAGRNVVSVLRNTGNWTFAAAQDTSLQQPFAVLVTDLNGDKRPDVVACGQTGLNVMMNTGNANALLAMPVSYNVGFCQYLVAGDFDGDGKGDVVVGVNSQKLTVIPGKGDGTLGAARPSAMVGFQEAASADFNLDGRSDLAYTEFQRAGAQVLLANPDGSFPAAVSFAAGSRSSVVDTADFDLDGRPDVAIGDQMEHVVYLFRNISK